MIIGTLQFELFIRDAASIKDKRRVVKSLKDRLHREHLASVAEIAAHDSMSVAVLGVAVVGHEGKRVAQVLDAIQSKVESLTEAEVGGIRRELIHGDPDGTFGTDPDAADGNDADLAAELIARAESSAEASS